MSEDLVFADTIRGLLKTEFKHLRFRLGINAYDEVFLDDFQLFEDGVGVVVSGTSSGLSFHYKCDPIAFIRGYTKETEESFYNSFDKASRAVRQFVDAKQEFKMEMNRLIIETESRGMQ